MRVIAIALCIAACGAPSRPPTVSRAWPVLGTMMSVAAWSTDSARLATAIDAVRDSVELVDSIAPRDRRALTDSIRAAVLRRANFAPDSESLARGYALDRGAIALAGVADSALLDLGGQFLWMGRGRPTSRRVGIADPANSLRTRAVVEMRDGSVSTASQANDQPRTVTVLAPDALSAAVWSSALLPLGCDSVLVLAARVEQKGVHLSAVCVDSSGVRWTSDLEKRVVLPRSAVRAAGQAGRGP